MVTQKHSIENTNSLLGSALIAVIALEFWATKSKFASLKNEYHSTINPFLLWILHLIGNVMVLLNGLSLVFGDNFTTDAKGISTFFMVAVMIKELVLLGFMFSSNKNTNVPEPTSVAPWRNDLIIFMYSLIVHGIVWGSIEANRATELAKPIPGDHTAAVMIFLLNLFSVTFLFTLSYLASRITVVYEDILRVHKTKQGAIALFASYLFVVAIAVWQVLL